MTTQEPIPTVMQPEDPSVLGLEEMREKIHTDQLKRIAEQKDALTENPELRQLIADVAAIRGTTVDTNYEEFDGEHSLRASMRAVFDFRTKPDGSYGERWEAEENAKEFLSKCDEELKDRIYEVAEAFGLTGDTKPKVAKVKTGVKLGGGGKSPLDRTLYGEELVEAGELEPEYLVALGSSRVIDDDEIERAGSYAEGAKTEFDLMVNAAKAAYGITVDSNDVLTWKDQSLGSGIPNENKVVYIPANGKYPPLFILSSAMLTNPYRQTIVNGEKKTVLRNRTNTEDTFDMLGRMAEYVPGDKVVAVTNAHFRPFQGAAAAGQLAKYGVETEVVGFDPQHFGNAPKRSDELLQEMLTTADSLAKATPEGKKPISKERRAVVAEHTGRTTMRGVV